MSNCQKNFAYTFVYFAEDVSNFVISNFLIPFILILSSTDMVLSQVTVNNNNLSENTSIQCQQSDPPTTDTSVQEPSHDISMVTPSTQADPDKGNEECVIPVTPKKHSAHSDLPLLSTSGKNLREYGFHGQGKTPRRKRFEY